MLDAVPAHVLGRTRGNMASARRTIRIIDPHVHVWKHDPPYPFAKGANVPAGRRRLPRLLLELMKANGVAKTVIIQVIHYRYDNSYLANVLKQISRDIPGRRARRSAGSGSARPSLATSERARLSRRPRLSPSGNAVGDWINGPLMPPLWKRCEELKVPMTILAPITRMPDVAARSSRSTPDLTA